MILGTGSLPDAEPGIRRGLATFLVRGEKEIALDMLARSDAGWVARLRVGLDVGEVAQVKRQWRGDIVIEGYRMAVTITEDWEITFDG